MRQTGWVRVLALFVTLSGAQAHAACVVEQRGQVAIESVDGHILVPVRVNEVDLTFILDTGAERTLMGEDIIRRLSVERDGWVASVVAGIGGNQQRPNALPRSLTLGGAALRRRTLAGDSSVTVGPLPVSEVAGRSIAGLLGRDFLAPFDLDLDVPDRRLTLYQVSGCAAWFLPWTSAYAVIPATMPTGTALVLQAQIDGQTLRALVDTGATASLITAPGMFRLALTSEMLAGDPGGWGAGVGANRVPMRLHRFGEMRIGPDVTQNAGLWVASVRVVPVVDMLLGADWLSTRRVWLSFSTKQVFIAAIKRG